MTDEIFSTGSNSEQVVLDAGKIVDCRARDVSLYAPGMCPSMLHAPQARYEHTAIWTGTEMIIWGGSPGSAITLNTGAKYNPVSDSWIVTTTTDVPGPRSLHTSVWTGTEMLIWGGSPFPNSTQGGKYKP